MSKVEDPTGIGKPTRPWYRKKRWWLIGGFIVLIIAAGSSNTKPTSTSTAPVSSPTTTAPTTSTAAPATTKTTVPTRHVTGTPVTLGAGTFTGGKDVAVGLYNVTAGTGQSGNFSVSGNDSYNEILGTDPSIGGVPEVRTQISNGDQIQISGLSQVTFTPVNTTFSTTHTLTNLYAGTFTVGQDIGVGRYVVTPGAGQSGNFSVSGNDSYNEILGGGSAAGGVPSVTVTLSKGDTIDISGLSQVTFTPI